MIMRKERLADLGLSPEDEQEILEIAYAMAAELGIELTDPTNPDACFDQIEPLARERMVDKEACTRFSEAVLRRLGRAGGGGCQPQRSP
jgi:hypothetical protein